MLSTVYILSTNIVSLNQVNAFAGTPISSSTFIGTFGSIYVPASLVEAYKMASVWSIYAERIVAYGE
jgi:hypothetical protein